MDTYEIEYRRRQNGETIAVVSFYSEGDFRRTLGSLIQQFNLKRLPPSKKNEERYAIRKHSRVGVVIIARHHTVRPSVRATVEAGRLLS
jgi:hypothetical protein